MSPPAERSMSARSAGRIAALVTAKSLGVPVQRTARTDPEPVVLEADGGTRGEQQGVAQPLVPQVEPGALVSSGETSALRSLVSYIPSEALTIYLAGVAAVNLVRDPSTSGEKIAAAWILYVIAAIANAAFLWIAFRDKFREYSRRELTVRQTRPLAAAFLITELALFVYALAVPGGIAVSDLQWLPLVLLIGAAVTVGLARLFGLAALRDDAEL